VTSSLEETHRAIRTNGPEVPPLRDPRIPDSTKSANRLAVDNLISGAVYEPNFAATAAAAATATAATAATAAVAVEI